MFKSIEAGQLWSTVHGFSLSRLAIGRGNTHHYNFNFFQYNQKDKEKNFVTQSLVFYGFNTVYTFLLKILFF